MNIISEGEVDRLQNHMTEARFGRPEFLEIIRVEKPRIIYTDGEKYFFFIAGLAVSTTECAAADFGNEYVLLPWVTGKYKKDT